jgi:hypothetical protein
VAERRGELLKGLCSDLNVNIASITSTVGLGGSTASNGVVVKEGIQQLK